jgi:hypothetical protein
MRRCGAGGAPEACSPMGTWEPEQKCPFVCTGQGQCTGTCKPANRRCGPNSVQSCTSDGAWSDTQSCPLGCDSGRLACITCQPKPEDCTNGTDDDCDGKVDCADSDCSTGKACGSGRVCNNGACVSCNAGAQCGNNPCKNGKVDCSTGSPQCKETSKSDGTICGNGGSCSGGTETRADTCQSGSCQVGDKRSCAPFQCSGNQCATKCPSGEQLINNICTPCGQLSQVCCPGVRVGDACGFSNSICLDGGPPGKEMACYRCGDLAGTCCPGLKCQSGLGCDFPEGTDPVHTSLCLDCGASAGMPCCSSGPACAGGLACVKTTNRCQ